MERFETEMRIKGILESLDLDITGLQVGDDFSTIIDWDSLKLINLVIALESEFSCTLDLAVYERLTSISSIVDVLILK